MARVKKISGCQEVGGGGGVNRWRTEDSQGTEDTMYDTIMTDPCHYISVQTQRMHSTKSEP